jgi:alpha-glucoside transport system permease protein
MKRLPAVKRKKEVPSMERLLLGIFVILGVPAITVLYILLIEWFLGLLPDRTRTVIRPWLWIGPAIILLFFYLIYPTINTIYLSFLNGNSTELVGVENYIFTFTNPAMLQAIRNNILWLVFFTLFTVGFGFLIALLADRVRYESGIKALVFMPMAISYVASGVIWKLMYQYDPPVRTQTGTLNAIYTSLTGAEPVPWLITQPINNFALIMIGVWMWTGFATVILSAALKSIPDEILEAARIDGANEVQILRSITIPMISSTIAVVSTTMIINVLKIFDIPYVMTNGQYGTEVIALRMYKEMFNIRHFGRASAIAVILFLAIVPVMIINIKRFREQEATR